jgi:hypothetical protein
MKKLALFLFVAIITTTAVHSQGCIMVRNISGFGQYNFADNAFSTSEWQMNLTNRYFKSYRDVKGTTFLNVPEDSVQVNRIYNLDITLTRMLRNGWSLSLSVPVLANNRSSELEHGGFKTPRHSTQSFGLGDIRFTAYKWILAPTPHQKGNIQVGLGMKLPTGDYKYQDYFYRKEDSLVLAPVNPSIQLGDGGTGLITEVNTFYNLGKSISLYGNFYYLINPRDVNGTSNLLGRIPTTPALKYVVKAGADINSVPDQYSLRAGVDFKAKKFVFSAGMRMEGIPVDDLIGNNNGLRRPGYNISVEPGIVYIMKNLTIYSYVPIIMARETKQSFPDKRITELSHTYTLGGGGFANYVIFFGVQFSL